jgi:dihydrofolate synthase/folylpolyglutamate synthase
VRVNERIQIDGVEIGDGEFAEAVEAVLAAFPSARSTDDPLTFFEFNTAMALWHFARRGIDVAILETGLGGRLDATNAVHPKVTVVTRIALDHTALLGGTLAAIAGEKAGIFKPGARVVLARQPSEALGVLEACAQAVGERPLVAGRDFALEPDGAWSFRGPGLEADALALSLAGPHQRENAETAIQAARLMLPSLTSDQIREGLATTRWPGRLELVSGNPPTLLDGAHNPDGARALAQAMRTLHAGERIHLVFGALGDKDVEGITRELFPLADKLYLARPHSERAMSAEGLQALARAQGRSDALFGSVGQALDAARADALNEGAGALVLVAGSLYVVGEARAHLRAG